MGVCTCGRAWGGHRLTLTLLLSTLCFETWPLIEAGAHQVSQPGLPASSRDLPLSTPPSMEDTVAHWTFTGALGIELRSLCLQSEHWLNEFSALNSMTFLRGVLWTGTFPILLSPTQGMYRIQENIPDWSWSQAGCQLDWNSPELGKLTPLRSPRAWCGQNRCSRLIR